MSKWNERWGVITKATRDGMKVPAKDVKCEKCGKRADHRHHEDYSRPLDVKYLCRKCHIELHMKEGTAFYGKPRLFNFDRIPVGGYGMLRGYGYNVSKASSLVHQTKLRAGGEFKCFAWGDDVVVFRLK